MKGPRARAASAAALAIVLNGGMAEAGGFTYGNGERELVAYYFDREDCCSDWMLPDVFENSRRGLVLADDAPWSAATLAATPGSDILDLAEGGISIYWTMSVLVDAPSPEHAKVMFEINVAPGEPEPRHIKLNIRPASGRSNPHNGYYHLSMDPGWKMKHEKDVYLRAPDRQFRTAGVREHFRVTLCRLRGDRVSVAPDFWEEGRGWRPFSTKSRQKLASEEWTMPGTLPMILEVADHLDGRTRFTSISIRWRKPDMTSVHRFAITRHSCRSTTSFAAE